MPDWLKRQWNDLKGNVKYGIVFAAGTGIVTAVTVVSHGLLWWQQAILVGCFVLLFGGAITAWTWRKGKSAPPKSVVLPISGTKEGEQWAYTPLKEVYDKNFHDQEVRLDGYSYTNCTWDKNVTFLYDGAAPLKFVNCHFLPSCTFKIKTGNMSIKMFIEFATYLNMFRDNTLYSTSPPPGN